MSKLTELSTGGNLTPNSHAVLFILCTTVTEAMVDGTIRFQSSFTLHDTDSSFIQIYKIISSSFGDPIVVIAFYQNVFLFT